MKIDPEAQRRIQARATRDAHINDATNALKGLLDSVLMGNDVPLTAIQIGRLDGLKDRVDSLKRINGDEL